MTEDLLTLFLDALAAELPPQLDPQHRAELLAMGCVEPGTEEAIDVEEFE